MTTLALRNLSLPNPFKAVTGFFASVGTAMQMSRQIAANEQIARVLLIEYPEHTYYSLLAELNYKTMEAYKKNV